MDHMIERTQLEIVRTLFNPTGKNAPPTDQRIEALASMVFDLLMEVEALRAAQLTLGGGGHDSDSAYGRAYRETAYLTHNSCGPSSGFDKLLSRFYPPDFEKQTGTPRRERTWRECLMLQRLGFSTEQIREYKEEAEEAELFT